MKNSLEITRKYQFGYMFLAHLKAMVVCITFQAVACWGFFDNTVARYIIAGVFALVYGMMLYSYARKLSGFDNKQYTPLQPNIKWGFLWGLSITVVTVLMMIIHKVNWDFNNVSAVSRIIINILTFAWLSPYFGFYDIQSNLPIWAAIIMVVIPMLATTLGYFAGNKNFNLLEKIDSLTFEKEEDEE